MPCFRPRDAYRSRYLNAKTGKYPVSLSFRDGFYDLPQTLPCKKCIGCRLEHSRQWAIRCVHEAKMHHKNSFVTLTYSPEHLPHRGQLVFEHAVKFMKDLRERERYRLEVAGYDSPESREPFAIRSFGCGEYGEKNSRPHFHILLFNYDPPDKTKLHKTKRGDTYYRSDFLDEVWGKGHVVVGDVTFESAAYVARYVTKKFTGKGAAAHYERVDESTGEVYQLVPEDSCCVSRRPGIGATWLNKNFSDVYPFDEVIIRDRAMKPPAFYDRLFEKLAEKCLVKKQQFTKMKRKRKIKAKRRTEEQSTPRLLVREQSAKLNLEHKLTRRYEREP